MRRNPERLAWLVLLVSLSACLVIAVATPLSVRLYLQRATALQPPSLVAVGGTVSVEKWGAEEATAVTATLEGVPQNSWVYTYGSQAFLRFFDESIVTLYRDTEVAVLQSQMPRFTISSQPARIYLLVQRGRMRLDVAGEGDHPLQFRVRTPYSEVALGRGSYIVDVRASEARTICRYGEATVSASGEVVKLQPQERVVARSGSGLSGLLPAEQNLVANGDFRDPLAIGWEVYNLQSDPTEVEGQATIVDADERPFVLFSRRGAARNHAETGIVQRINEDVRGVSSLQLRLGVRLAYQSLPGGGYLSSEFPVIVRLDYRDAYGNDRFVTHGFYYVDPNQEWPIINGEKIPPQVWFPYESGNLLNWSQLREAPPAMVASISMYASGWEYDSMVAEVELLAER